MDWSPCLVDPTVLTKLGRRLYRTDPPGSPISESMPAARQWVTWLSGTDVSRLGVERL